MHRLLYPAAVLLFAAPASPVTMDWVTVGDPGNAADTQVMNDGTTGYGSVPYVYRISKYEVTNAQYAEFLNAKAASDPYGLYTTGMATDGGITRSGSSGTFSYSPVAGSETNPVNLVSFYDALRFTNWLHNGQGNGDTETGAYTLLGGTAIPSNGTTVTRNPGATIFLPSEHEWYKAAYYDAVALSYNPYPFADGFDGAVCDGPPGSTNHSANCNNPHNTTDVGAYTTSLSAYGTFDQGGNLNEWSETINSIGSQRISRGGDYGDPSFLAASIRNTGDPSADAINNGFRIAMIPEPGTALLVAGGLLVLATRRRAFRCATTSFPTGTSSIPTAQQLRPRSPRPPRR